MSTNSFMNTEMKYDFIVFFDTAMSLETNEYWLIYEH